MTLRHQRTLLLCVLAWACAAAVLAQPARPGLPASLASPAPDLRHCTASERVQFSCRQGAKTVSLCAAGTGDAGTLS